MVQGKTINFNSVDTRRIISSYNNGASARNIASIFSVDHKVITRVLRDNDVRIRGQSELEVENAKILIHIEEQICSFYKEGNTLAVTGKKFGKDPKVIKRVLLKYKVKVKTSGEQLMKFTNETAFEKIDSHEKAYWLGFIKADGSLSKEGQLS